MGRMLAEVVAILMEGVPVKVASETWTMVWNWPGRMVVAFPLLAQLHFPVLKSFSQQKRSCPQ